MGLREGIYAKIWSVRVNGDSYSGQLSVSKKDRETGKYKTLFSGFVNFYGDAAEKASELDLPEKMDRNNPVGVNVQIKSSPDVSSWFNNDKYTKTMAVVNKLVKAAGKNISEEDVEELTRCIGKAYDTKTITIYDFDVDEGNSSKPSKNAKAAQKSKEPTKTTKTKSKVVEHEDEDEDEDELPF